MAYIRRNHNLLLPPWQKEVVLLVALGCLIVCLFLFFVDNITQKVMNGLFWDDDLWRGSGQYNEELIKCWWWSWSSKMSKWAKHTLIDVSRSDRAAGNEPKIFWLAFHHHSSWLAVGYMGLIMICLGQGGYTLRVLLVYLCLANYPS